MTYTQYLLILKSHFWIILISFLVVVSAATAVNLLMPKSYTAATSLVLNYKDMYPVNSAASFLADQTKVLRQNLEVSQANISKYQQAKGLNNIIGSLNVKSANSMIYLANQSAIAALNPTTSTKTQSSPLVMCNIILVLGTMPGVCIALFAESVNRRIRIRDDLSNVLEVSVFTICGSPIQSGAKNLLGPPRMLPKAK